MSISWCTLARTTALLALLSGLPFQAWGQSWLLGDEPVLRPTSVESTESRRDFPHSQSSQECPIELRDFSGPLRRDPEGFPLPEGPSTRLGWPGFAAGSQIDGVWFSPDGEVLVGQVVGGRVLAWERRTERPIWGLVGKGIRPLLLAEEKGLLGVPTCDGLELREFGTGALVQKVALEGGAERVLALGPRGEWALGTPPSPGGRRNPSPKLSLALWEVPSGKIRWRRGVEGSPFRIRRQGPRAVLETRLDQGMKRAITVLNLDLGEEIFRLNIDERSDRLGEAVLVNGGRSIVIGQLNQAPFRIDLETGRRDAPYPGRGHALETDPSGKILLSSEPLVWDALTGELLSSPPRKPAWSTLFWNASSIAVAPDGETVAVAGHRIVLYQARTGLALNHPASRGVIQTLRFAPGGREVASVDGRGNLQTWTLPSGKRLASFPGSLEDGSPLAFSREGTRISGVARDQTWVHLDPTGKARKESQEVEGRVSNTARLSEDGEILFLLQPRSTTYFVNRWRKPKESTRLELPEDVYGGPDSCRLSGDGSVLIFQRTDRVLDFRDARTGALLGEIPGGSTLGPLSPDGRWFLRQDQQGRVASEVWSVSPLKKVWSFPESGSGKLGVFLPRRRLFLEGITFGGRLLLRDLASGTSRSFSHPTLVGIRSLVSDPEETQLAVVYYDGSALIWDLESILGQDSPPSKTRRSR